MMMVPLAASSADRVSMGSLAVALGSTMGRYAIAMDMVPRSQKLATQAEEHRHGQ